MTTETTPEALPVTVPSPGDGVVTIVLPDTEVKKMALDLPEGVGQVMMTETAANVQASNRNGRATSDLAAGALQATIVQNVKDIGVLEGRTASGILATPIASPTKTG